MEDDKVLWTYRENRATRDGQAAVKNLNHSELKVSMEHGTVLIERGIKNEKLAIKEARTTKVRED